MSDPKFSAPFPSAVPAPNTFSSSFPSWLAPVGSALDSLHAVRERLNLPDPGRSEEFGREFKRACNNHLCPLDTASEEVTTNNADVFFSSSSPRLALVFINQLLPSQIIFLMAHERILQRLSPTCLHSK